MKREKGNSVNYYYYKYDKQVTKQDGHDTRLVLYNYALASYTAYQTHVEQFKYPAIKTNSSSTIDMKLFIQGMMSAKVPIPLIYKAKDWSLTELPEYINPLSKLIKKRNANLDIPELKLNKVSRQSITPYIFGKRARLEITIGDNIYRILDMLHFQLLAWSDIWQSFNNYWQKYMWMLRNTRKIRYSQRYKYLTSYNTNYTNRLIECVDDMYKDWAYLKYYKPHIFLKLYKLSGDLPLYSDNNEYTYRERYNIILDCIKYDRFQDIVFDTRNINVLDLCNCINLIYPSFFEHMNIDIRICNDPAFLSFYQFIENKDYHTTEYDIDDDVTYDLTTQRYTNAKAILKPSAAELFIFNEHDLDAL